MTRVAAGLPAPLVRRAEAVIEPVVDRTLAYPFRIWGFGEGPALLGLIAAGKVLKRPELTGRVRALVAESLGTQPLVTDHLIPVDVLLALARECPGLDVSGALERYRLAVMNAPRPVPDEPQVHRPDSAPLRTTVWVDCLHLDGPGLALLSRSADAASLTNEVSSRLQDGSGLFSHGYDVGAHSPNGVHWARGQGWALAGLVGALVHGERDLLAGLRPRVQSLLEAITRYEVDGRWHTVVDVESAVMDNSLSPLVAAAALDGHAAGVLDDRWLGLAERALLATLDRLEDGALPVTTATPVGELDSYLKRDVGVFPWGQGPVLLALTAAIGGRR